jgi:molecular chaperone GrpE
MSDEQRAHGRETEGHVKVNDRRRFTAEGEPLPGSDQVPPAVDPPEFKAEPDPRDATLAQQAARIDELTRAYASLLDEGKAARGRMEREKARVLEAERAQLAQVLLEAVDELERALAAAGGASGPLVEGVGLTLASLNKRVAELGAERLATVGQRFDPHLHEAIELIQVAEPSQDDIVVQEVRAGYRIGGRVLRPARVRVGRLAQA